MNNGSQYWHLEGRGQGFQMFCDRLDIPVKWRTVSYPAGFCTDIVKMNRWNPVYYLGLDSSYFLHLNIFKHFHYTLNFLGIKYHANQAWTVLCFVQEFYLKKHHSSFWVNQKHDSKLILVSGLPTQKHTIISLCPMPAAFLLIPCMQII